MLFFIIFGLIMLALLIKALIETLYGAVLMAYAICLLVAGYSLKVIVFFLKIYEFIQERKQSQKVCFVEKSGSVHAIQKITKQPSNRIPNKSFSHGLPTVC